MTPPREPPLARLRALALALPGAVEKQAWGDPTFRVGDRIFAMVKTGDGRLSVWVKAPEGAQEMLIEAAPDRFFRPPYVGHKGWVGLRLDGPDGDAPDPAPDWEPDWEEVAFNLSRSHALIAAKRPRARKRD